MKNLLRILYSGIVIAPASLALVSVKYDNTTTATPKETVQEINFNTIRSEFISNFNNDTKFANTDVAMQSIKEFPKKANMKGIAVKSVTINSNVSTTINNYVAFDVKLGLEDEINTAWNVPGSDQIFTLTTYIDNRNLVDKNAYQESLEDYILTDNKFFKNSLSVKKQILKYNQVRSNDTVITSVNEGEKISIETEKVYKQKFEVNVIALDTYKWSTDKTSEVFEVIVQIDARDYVNPQEVSENLQASVANTEFISIANAQQAIENSEKVDGVKEIKAVFDKQVKAAINGKVLFKVTISIKEDFKWTDGTTEDKVYSIEAFVDERTEIDINEIEKQMNKHIESKGHFENPQAIVAAIEEFKFTGISNIKGEISNIHQRNLLTTSFKVTFDVDIDYKLKDQAKPTFYFEYQYAALLNIEDVETELKNSLKELEIYQSPEQVIAKLENTEILGVKEIKVQEAAKTRGAINGTFKVSLVADEAFLFEDLKNNAEIKISQDYAKVIKNSDVQEDLQNFLNQAHYESSKDIVTAIETKYVFKGLKNFKVVNTREAIMETFKVSFDTEAGYEMAKNESTQVTVKKDYAILLKTADIKETLELHLKDKHFETSAAIVQEIQTNFKFQGIKNISAVEAKAAVTKQYVVSFETESGYALDKNNDSKFTIEKDYAILLKTALIQTELNKYLGNKTFETADQIVNSIETGFSYKGIQKIKAVYPKGIGTKVFTVTFETAEGYALAPGEINSFTVEKSYVKYIKTQEVIDSVKKYIGTQEFNSQKAFIDFLVGLDDSMYKISSVKQKVEGGTTYVIKFTTRDGFELLENEKYSFDLNTSVRYTYDDILTTEYSNDFSINFNKLLYIFSNQQGKTIVHTLNEDREYKQVLELSEETSAVHIQNNKIYVGTAKGNLIRISTTNTIEKFDLKDTNGNASNRPIAALTTFNGRLFILGLNLAIYEQNSDTKFEPFYFSTDGSKMAYNMIATNKYLYYNINNRDTKYMAISQGFYGNDVSDIPNISTTSTIRQQFSAIANYGNYTIYSTGFGNEALRYMNTSASNGPLDVAAYSINTSPSGAVLKFAEMGENLFFTMKDSGKVYRFNTNSKITVQSDVFETNKTNKSLTSFDKLNGELYFTGNKFIGIRNSHIKLK